jgi:hypothetical protein
MLMSLPLLVMLHYLNIYIHGQSPSRNVIHSAHTGRFSHLIAACLVTASCYNFIDAQIYWAICLGVGPENIQRVGGSPEEGTNRRLPYLPMLNGLNLFHSQGTLTLQLLTRVEGLQMRDN